MNHSGTSLKTTPLHKRHIAAGANMADFGGYDMPLWYPSGVRQEHLAVLTTAGLFDTCHMAGIRVAGADAFALLQRCFTRDLKPLSEGRCTYGAFLNEAGHCIDDALIYKLGPDDLFLVANSGMGGILSAHLRAHAGEGAVTISDLSDALGKIDLQGPESARILSGLLEDPQEVLEGLVYFSFKGTPDAASPVRLKTGEPLFVSRTGYTGEFGFELFLAPETTPALWDALLEAGQERGLLPCGLAARDSLRAGAGLPLSQQDIGGWPFCNHPWPFTLPFDGESGAFTKPFVGCDALQSGPEMHTLLFVGDDPRKVGTAEARVLDETGTPIGRVLTCTTDMGITRHGGRVVSVNTPGLPEGLKFRGLACGIVLVDRPLKEGSRITLAEGKRSIGVSVTADIRPDRSARKAIKGFL